ncbi:MAG: class I SAM-dependent methyltransferase [Myxococcota bacterium]
MCPLRSEVLTSERLLRVASRVLPGAPMADVGTDHALLPAHLVRSGRIPSALACDARPGPLEQASTTIARHALGDRITTRLGDGLTPLAPEDGVATITICGMGAATIQKILTEVDPEPLCSRLVLQPNTDARRLRALARARDWCLTDEELVLESGRFYHVLQLDLGDPFTAHEAHEDMLFGEAVRRRATPAFGLWLRTRRDMLDTKRAHMQRARAPDTARIDALAVELAMIERELRRVLA